MVLYPRDQLTNFILESLTKECQLKNNRLYNKTCSASRWEESWHTYKLRIDNTSFTVLDKRFTHLFSDKNKEKYHQALEKENHKFLGILKKYVS